ncbi:MAG: NAD(P)H-binding protein [Methyloceanibacter sp.]|uniref:NAD(P)H-binding protein n=1 Tax=Methyloceanibacter sp. TaxID=1965321 RepID=UPI003EDF9FCE
MRCLVTGAYGFIGREVVTALIREGVSVVGAGRDLDFGRRIFPDIDWIACDFNRDTDVSQWRERLGGIDAVVNCVGILQGTVKDNAERIHGDATIALFEACTETGVRRVVHVSAVSAESDVVSGYARSKAKADTALASLDLDWVIVKPSLVIGPGAYGGTALMRGLAGLPYILPLPGPATERFQPIAADDLARGIVKLVTGETVRRETLFAAGPEALSVRDILRSLRAWLGFAPAWELAVPLPLLRILLRFGDVAGWIGHASAVRTTSLTQMLYDRIVDGERFARIAGPVKTFAETLQSTPATMQDRLHARAYFAVPFLQVALAVFWILSGLIALGPSTTLLAGTILAHIGVDPALAQPLVALGAAVDVLAGILFLVPGWVRRAGALQLAISTVYLVGLSVVAPALWFDPFGALLKIVPLMGATLVVMAFQEKR